MVNRSFIALNIKAGLNVHEAFVVCLHEASPVISHTDQGSRGGWYFLTFARSLLVFVLRFHLLVQFHYSGQA